MTAPRLAHHREGHVRFTLTRILAEEATVLELADARDDRAVLPPVGRDITKDLSPDQAAAVTAIAASEQLVCPLAAPAGAGKTTSMRALREAAHRGQRQVIVVAPTGQAVDVALREGAADRGFTVAKAVKDLRAGKLNLDARHLIIIDEAGMVGTDALRELFTAATAAAVKTVPIGDEHQLAPVLARGGMFSQLVEDLPWTQKLSQVWRMKDPEERAASVALGQGGPAPRRRAVQWYADNGRLAIGDDVAMAEDAVTAWKADVEAGRDALLIGDRRATVDALNVKIHNERVDAQAEAVKVGRGQRVAVGDVIITRQNDARIELDDAAILETPDPVRNGNRWRVTVADERKDLIVARRLSDDARAMFRGEYLAEHVQLGYAVTVHTAQGVTCDTAHAVLSEDARRGLLYVAMSRGREDNRAYVYDRRGPETEHEHEQVAAVHVARRGDTREAAEAVARIAATRDDRPRTAHQVAAQTTDRSQLPDRVAERLKVRDRQVAARRARWRQLGDKLAQQAVAQRRRRQQLSQEWDRDAERSRRRDRKADRGRELGL